MPKDSLDNEKNIISNWPFLIDSVQYIEGPYQLNKPCQRFNFGNDKFPGIPQISEDIILKNDPFENEDKYIVERWIR